jgi:hypothetical protein
MGTSHATVTRQQRFAPRECKPLGGDQSVSTIFLVGSDYMYFAIARDIALAYFRADDREPATGLRETMRTCTAESRLRIECVPRAGRSAENFSRPVRRHLGRRGDFVVTVARPAGIKINPCAARKKPIALGRESAYKEIGNTLLTTKGATIEDAKSL